MSVPLEQWIEENGFSELRQNIRIELIMSEISEEDTDEFVRDIMIHVRQAFEKWRIKMLSEEFKAQCAKQLKELKKLCIENDLAPCWRCHACSLMGESDDPWCQNRNSAPEGILLAYRLNKDTIPKECNLFEPKKVRTK